MRPGGGLLYELAGAARMKRLLFVCVENSCRSQIAEAFARIHGYDLTKHESKSLTDIPDVEYDFVATMGCGDECPFVRAKEREEWDIPDPKNLPPDQFRLTRDLIEQRIKTFCSMQGAQLLFCLTLSREVID
jgi:arsenate reductase (thioredoxin)